MEMKTQLNVKREHQPTTKIPTVYRCTSRECDHCVYEEFDGEYSC